MTPRSLLTLALLAACKGPAPAVGDTADTSAQTCLTSFTYTPTGADPVDGVYLGGSFNDWDYEASPMSPAGDGSWTASLALEPGAYAYKVVEFTEWSVDGYAAWVCDPEADLVHCEEGYKDPSSTEWSHECGSGTESACNSMVVVPQCETPSLDLSSLHIDRAAGSVDLSVRFIPSGMGAALDRFTATLDDATIQGTTGQDSLELSTGGLSPGRHTVRVVATDLDGHAAEELYIPFWTDVAQADDGWRQGSVYYAFLDRLANGDTANDSTEGASANAGEYQGGDIQGLIDLLPYLEDLGVGTIWISNPQDNAEGAFSGDCEQTYSAYHAYWPDAARTVEEHFGDDDSLRELVAQAHSRGMRVIMDWVANQLHEDHPYLQEHGEDWESEFALCEDNVGGQLNFDRIPETCWFSPYLPDIDYTNPEPLDVMVEDAIWWVKTYELDGLRIDAAKHMPHSVQWNLQSRIEEEIEHHGAGGDEQFWTVGETFDSYDRIAEYIGPHQLDGQFDFPLYYGIQGAFGTGSSSLGTLESLVADSDAAFSGALMSNFLGNHDVMRFVTYATEGYVDSCQGGNTLVQAAAPEDWDPYLRLRLAFTFLLTQPSPPLVYYGDEIGLPGYTDPDDRQPLWWHTGDVSGGAVGSVADLAARVDAPQAYAVEAIGALGRARHEHPAMWRGTTTEWWLSPSDWPTLWGYARLDDETGDAVLVLLNTGGEDQTLTNGLAFAGLPTGGGWTDVLTGEQLQAEGDQLTVTVWAQNARVLVAD